MAITELSLIAYIIFLAILPIFLHLNLSYIIEGCHLLSNVPNSTKDLFTIMAKGPLLLSYFNFRQKIGITFNTLFGFYNTDLG